MQRWGMDASRLPPGSAVFNRGPSVWERYRRVILAVVSLLLLLAGVVVYLLIERAKRLRVQHALEADIVKREKAEAALIDPATRQASSTKWRRRSRARCSIAG